MGQSTQLVLMLEVFYPPAANFYIPNGADPQVAAWFCTWIMFTELNHSVFVSLSYPLLVVILLLVYGMAVQLVVCFFNVALCQ